MYMVISRWQPKPGREAEFEQIGREMRAMMSQQPGMKFMNAIRGDDGIHAVHVYEDEAAYKRLVEDPNGPFAQAAQAKGIENVADWLGSVRGETVD